MRHPILLPIAILSCAGLALSLIPGIAHAGTIIQRPLYVGLSNGLVGYWSFNGDTIAGPDAGGTYTAYDRSGQGNNGVFPNRMRPAIGRIGQTLYFNGGDLVDMGNPASLPITGSLTTSAWVNATSSIKDQDIIGKWTGDFGYLMGLTIDNVVFQGGCAVSVDGSSVSAVRYSATSLYANKWYHIACVYNAPSQTLDIYINGVKNNGTLTGTVPSSISNATSNVHIGRSFGTQSFGGLIDEARIYNRALTPDEIKRLYKMGGTAKIGVAPVNGTLSNGLVAYWPFSGNDLDVDNGFRNAYDRSGNENRAQILGGVVSSIGRIGQGVQFDGLDGSYVKTYNAVDVGASNSFSFWVNPTATSSSPSGFDILTLEANSGSGGTTDGYRLFINTFQTFDKSIHFEVGDGATQGGVTSPTGLVQDGKWQNIVFTFTGGTYRIYLNGAKVAQATDAVVWKKNAVVCIGAQCNPVQSMNGSIDEVRIYNRALTPDEIKRLYKIGGTTKFGVAPVNGTLQNGLVGYWSFDPNDIGQGASNGFNLMTIRDHSGMGNTASGTTDLAPTLTIGRIGQAIKFSTTGFSQSNSMQVTRNTALEPTAVSLSAWIKNSNPQTGNNIAFLSKTYQNNTGPIFGSYQLGVNYSGDPTAIYFQTGFAATDDLVSTGVIPTSPKWEHVVGTYDPVAGIKRLYLNGVLINSKAVSSAITYDTTPSGNLYFGANGGGSPYLGTLDDIRIYNRALTPDEVKRLYEIGR